MPKTEKIEKVAELKERIQSSEALFLADFRGLTVSESGELRRSLTNAGARFAVVKNTLMRLAAIEAGAPELEGLLEGPTAVAFVDADPIAAAKSLADATRKFRTLVVKGGFLDGRVLTPEEAQSLATIEPREVLLAKMAGLAKAEMSRAAFMFNALQSRFLALLEALKEKMPGEAVEEPAPAAEEPATEEPAPAAEEPAAEEPAAAAEEPVAEEPVAEVAETPETPETPAQEPETEQPPIESAEAPEEQEVESQASETPEAEESQEEGA
jgi:large subunit ribosomal protein L10